jgi:hypothetical protein
MRYILRLAFLAVLFAFATSAHAQDCSNAYQTAPSGTQVPPDPLCSGRSEGSATDRLHLNHRATPRLYKLEIHLDGNGVENTRRHRQSKRLALPAGIPSDTAPGSKQ